MYRIGKVYTKNVIEDFDLFFEINEFKKAKQVVYTGFSNGCRGLDFEFYEIHFANEEIAQNIEKLFQIKNNDMENTKSKSVFIRNKTGFIVYPIFGEALWIKMFTMIVILFLRN